jgi:hypothetical protein
MSQVQTRTVRKKAGNVSFSAEFFTFATPREAPGATPANRR